MKCYDCFWGLKTFYFTVTNHVDIICERCLVLYDFKFVDRFFFK